MKDLGAVVMPSARRIADMPVMSKAFVMVPTGTMQETQIHMERSLALVCASQRNWTILLLMLKASLQSVLTMN